MALVLAGSRSPDDAVARQAGLRHKALVPVGGRPMIARVLETLRAAGLERTTVCIDSAALADADAETRRLFEAPGIALVAPAPGPSASVRNIVDDPAMAWPLLLTTADHPLLTPAMVEHFCRNAPADADVAVGVARASLIRQQQPDSIRTFYRFADDGYSGCNLFLLRGPRARALVEFWARLESHRKRPWRMVLAIGPLTLLRFAFGRLTLAEALARLSALAGAKVDAVDMPFAEAAIDVDKAEDLALAERILAARG
jgi:GTP:adenosylcobinamide-phosphate guanylyltransferase